MHSMTGFGGASRISDPYKINIEVKALNSKYADIRIKLPPELSNLEMDLRQMTLQSVTRGKVEVSLSLEGQNLKSNLCEIDEQVFTNYYHQIQTLSGELNLGSSDTLSSILQLPGVVKIIESKVDETMKENIFLTLKEALTELSRHRKKEGEALATALAQSTENIMIGKEKILELEEERMEAVKARLYQHLEQHIPPEKIDSGRFEQELIYYLDKMDIHEEMIRLDQHCQYFLGELVNEEITKGKKLTFISQEIGREINTLGAKASHSEIQRLVVEMKNELDKIKEQLANVL